MSRLATSLAAGALALGLCLASAPGATAASGTTGGTGGTAATAGLTSCGDYYKVKNISCKKAAPVVERGLAMLLDEDAKVVRFDGWTCRRADRQARDFRCTKKAMVVAYSST